MSVENVEAGEQLVKQNLITQEELAEARAHEARSGVPWYKQFVQSGRVSFGALEDVLRYEFHLPSTKSKQQQLGDTLVEMKAITAQQLKAALAEQKRSGRLLGSVLLEHEYVTEEAIARALSRQQGLEFASLSSMPSSREALETVSESIARSYQFVPVALEGDKLTVLIVDPRVRGKLNDAGVLLSKRLYPIMTSAHDLKKEIESRYEALRKGEAPKTSKAPPKAPVAPAQTVQKSVEKKTAKVPEMTEDTKAAAVKNAVEPSRFEEIAQKASGATVIKLVSTIIEGAVNSGATDIHLDPQEPEMRVRYRIDGVLHDVMSIPENIELAVISRIKILAELDITETRHPQDGHISTDIGGKEFDIRVATLPTFLGERIVLRLLDQTSILSGIKDLGLEKSDEETLLGLISQPYGMILVTGPTGSGKTTTLYAALNQKNVMTDSIVTLEDPVEYQLSGINQVQIDPDIGVTFATTLRAAMRQDIDVLLVGEIRDAETAHIATRAAMTGHLVFSTLHTNDAPEAISTLRNMGVPSFLISSALTAVIAQRLVRKVCTNCRTGYKPPQDMLRAIGLPLTTKQLYSGKGCDTCYHTGNRGRTGIFEILEITPDIRRMIAADAGTHQIAEAAKLVTMAERCREKVKAGIVEPREYLRVIRQ